MHYTELKARRTALGLTQRQLASAIEVSPNTVARWERGELTIDRPNVLRYLLGEMQRDKSAHGAQWPAAAENWLQRQRG